MTADMPRFKPGDRVDILAENIKVLCRSYDNSGFVAVWTTPIDIAWIPFEWCTLRPEPVPEWKLGDVVELNGFRWMLVQHPTDTTLCTWMSPYKALLSQGAMNDEWTRGEITRVGGRMTFSIGDRVTVHAENVEVAQKYLDGDRCLHLRVPGWGNGTVRVAVPILWCTLEPNPTPKWQLGDVIEIDGNRYMLCDDIDPQGLMWRNTRASRMSMDAMDVVWRAGHVTLIAVADAP